MEKKQDCARGLCQRITSPQLQIYRKDWADIYPLPFSPAQKFLLCKVACKYVLSSFIEPSVPFWKRSRKDLEERKRKKKKEKEGAEGARGGKRVGATCLLLSRAYLPLPVYPSHTVLHASDPPKLTKATAVPRASSRGLILYISSMWGTRSWQAPCPTLAGWASLRHSSGRSPRGSDRRFVGANR